MGLDGAAVGVGREGERDMEWCSSEGGREGGLWYTGL